MKQKSKKGLLVQTKVRAGLGQCPMSTDGPQQNKICQGDNDGVCKDLGWELQNIPKLWTNFMKLPQSN